jgi:hypothetical protein
MLSETLLKPHERCFISNYHFYRTDRFPRINAGNSIAVRKGIPHNQADLPQFVSAEATGVSIRNGNSEELLAKVLCHQATPGMMQISVSS